MTDLFNAFEISPVPAPGPDAVAPEPFRGIYGMPMFVTVPTPDLDASVAFWTRAFGFFELFRAPGRLVHLRRWAFQDVLLVRDEGDVGGGALGTAVPASSASSASSAPSALPAASTVSFACVLGEVDGIVAACRRAAPDATSGPVDTAWNTRDVTVVTPEGVRVVFTAAKPFDPDSTAARNLAAMGITASDETTA